MYARKMFPGIMCLFALFLFQANILYGTDAGIESTSSVEVATVTPPPPTNGYCQCKEPRGRAILAKAFEVIDPKRYDYVERQEKDAKTGKVVNIFMESDAERLKKDSNDVMYRWVRQAREGATAADPKNVPCEGFREGKAPYYVCAWVCHPTFPTEICGGNPEFVGNQRFKNDARVRSPSFPGAHCAIAQCADENGKALTSTSDESMDAIVSGDDGNDVPGYTSAAVRTDRSTDIESINAVVSGDGDGGQSSVSIEGPVTNGDLVYIDGGDGQSSVSIEEPAPTTNDAPVLIDGGDGQTTADVDGSNQTTITSTENPAFLVQ